MMEERKRMVKLLSVPYLEERAWMENLVEVVYWQRRVVEMKVMAWLRTQVDEVETAILLNHNASMIETVI